MKKKHTKKKTRDWKIGGAQVLLIVGTVLGINFFLGGSEYFPGLIKTTNPTVAAYSKIPCEDFTSMNFNCSHFKTQAQAQAFYNRGVLCGFKDMHGLDRDLNGQVCEALP